MLRARPLMLSLFSVGQNAHEMLATARGGCLFSKGRTLPRDSPERFGSDMVTMRLAVQAPRSPRQDVN